MKKTEVKRDFKVLAEKISPENVLVMSELLAIKETKTLTCFMGSFAEKAHEKLCCDVFLKDLRGYVLSDCYDMVQGVAALPLRTFRRVSGRFPVYLQQRKRISIKVECYLIIERALCGKYRTAKRCISLEKVKQELQYIADEDTEKRRLYPGGCGDSIAESYRKHDPCSGLQDVGNELSRHSKDDVESNRHGL